MITIINDTGSVRGTRIVDSATGIDLGQCCTGLSIEMAGVDAVVTGKVSLGMLRTQVALGRAEWLIANPLTGNMEPVRSLTMADGTMIDFGDDGTPTIVPSVTPVGDGIARHGRTAVDHATPAPPGKA